MNSSESFPTVYLIGFGQMLAQFLGQPLEKAVASSPQHKVVATRDEGSSSFDIHEESVARKKILVGSTVR